MKTDTIKELITKLNNNQEIAAAKLISLLENEDVADKIIPLLHHRTQNAYTIGITGAPGVGKSTLTKSIVKELRNRDFKVGIIAVDPSSPFSGGAILGDRIRLQEFAADSGVFIRSMASRGNLGGISVATIDAMKILDAYNCDYIIVETVGVGQSEIEIVKHVDTTLLVLVPGMGDDIQVLKAGIMEIADIFVINKADKEGVDRIEYEIDMLLNLGSHEKKPPVCKVIARDDIGINSLFSFIEKHKSYLINSGKYQEKRKKKLEFELKHIINSKLMQFVLHHIEENYNFGEVIEKIFRKEENPYSFINSVINDILKK